MYIVLSELPQTKTRRYMCPYKIVFGIYIYIYTIHVHLSSRIMFVDICTYLYLLRLSRIGVFNNLTLNWLNDSSSTMCLYSSCPRALVVKDDVDGSVFQRDGDAFSAGDLHQGQGPRALIERWTSWRGSDGQDMARSRWAHGFSRVIYKSYMIHDTISTPE